MYQFHSVLIFTSFVMDREMRKDSTHEIVLKDHITLKIFETAKIDNTKMFDWQSRWNISNCKKNMFTVYVYLLVGYKHVLVYIQTNCSLW